MTSSVLDTKTKILKATIELLEASQGRGVRMTDIAKQAGVSRQALYLHFATRVDLLISATYYLDELLGSDERLLASREATTGIARLDAFVENWADYIPEIYGIAKALLIMRDTDAEAAKAWDDRMLDMRDGCAAAISALAADNMLAKAYAPEQATDLLWMMLSVRNWELLTIQQGWSQERYRENLMIMARRTLVAASA